MVASPADCVREIKERLKESTPERLTVSEMFRMLRELPAAVGDQRYATVKVGPVVLAFFNGGDDNISRQVELLLRQERGIASERADDTTLWAYPADNPPSDKLRQKIKKSRPLR